MGYYAIELLEQGTFNRVIAFKDGKYVDYDIEEALAMTKSLDMEEYRVLEALTKTRLSMV